MFGDGFARVGCGWKAPELPGTTRGPNIPGRAGTDTPLLTVGGGDAGCAGWPPIIPG